MRNRSTLIRTVLLAVCLLTAGAAFGDGILVGAANVEFVTGGAAGQLSVSGPGNVRFSQSFKTGETASLSLYDGDGGLLPDGIYTWEIAFDGVAAGDREDYAGQGEHASGAFSIAGGAFVDPNLIEGGMTKDQVILDDLIVDGSICAGFDCVNGESFGFDTLRLKENNLRIKAQDTSTSASFPTRDWQITFNETSNGGAEKFAIDDIDGGRTPFTIRAGAPSNSLFVDSGGRLGIGTSTPVVNLHVKTGNTPTLRLEQDGSQGFTAQTWDVAGNEANFFIRDATNGSTLPFRIRLGAPTSAIDIDAQGDIGFGTSSPSSDFDGSGRDASIHVRRTDGEASIFVEEASGTVAQRSLMRLSNNGGVTLNLVDETESNNWQLKVAGSGAGRVFQLNSSGFGVNNPFSLDGTTGNLTIVGGLVTGTAGSCTVATPCDGVFKDYALESIEDHAAYMWQNAHLRGVGPTPADAPINITRKTTGILHELEKAHIYIEQLHSSVKELQERLDALEAPRD